MNDIPEEIYYGLIESVEGLTPFDLNLVTSENPTFTMIFVPYTHDTKLMSDRRMPLAYFGEEPIETAPGLENG